MTPILDALFGLGIINMIENIPAKKKIRGYPMLQISLTLIVKMITGLDDLHELENEVEDDPLLAMFCTIENDDTPSISTLSRDVERYSVAELWKSCKLILQWLKELKLIDGSVASIDSSKIYTEGKVQEEQQKCTITLKMRIRGATRFSPFTTLFVASSSISGFFLSTKQIIP
jgi:hypothetical protein